MFVLVYSPYNLVMQLAILWVMQSSHPYNCIAMTLQVIVYSACMSSHGMWDFKWSLISPWNWKSLIQHLEEKIQNLLIKNDCAWHRLERQPNKNVISCTIANALSTRPTGLTSRMVLQFNTWYYCNGRPKLHPVEGEGRILHDWFCRFWKGNSNYLFFIRTLCLSSF